VVPRFVDLSDYDIFSLRSSKWPLLFPFELSGVLSFPPRLIVCSVFCLNLPSSPLSDMDPRCDSRSVPICPLVDFHSFSSFDFPLTAAPLLESLVELR